jgi:radical SAM superfamily enzyme YgiQ (UPF0313 family)
MLRNAKKHIPKESDVPKNELDKLRDVGLSLFYVGIETGNDALLKKVTKGATSKGILELSKSKTAWIYFILYDNSRTWW